MHDTTTKPRVEVELRTERPKLHKVMLVNDDFTPREFVTITVTDGIAMGHSGMKSSLVSRETIADSVELSVRGHCYDALVAIAGWALLFVTMTGELQAAALLSSTTKNRTVGMAMLDAYNNGAYAPLAALALVLTLVTSTIVVLSLLVVRRLSRWGRSGSGMVVS